MEIQAAYSLITVFAVIAAQSVTQSSTSSVQAPESLPVSPCPKIFRYEQRSTEAGKWYGVVNLNTESTLYSLWLNIVLDSEADILGNWVGEVTTKDHIDFKVENTKMQINPGPALPVRFFVQYNPKNKTPKLKYIRLNGIEICNIEQTQNENFNSQDLSLIRNRGGNVKTDKAKLMTDVWPGTNEWQTTTWKSVQLDSSIKTDSNAKLQSVVGELNGSTVSKTKLYNKTTSKPNRWDTSIEPWLGADTKKDTLTKIDSHSRTDLTSTSTTKEILIESGTGSNIIRPNKGERDNFESGSKKTKQFDSKTGHDSVRHINSENNGFNSQSDFNERGDSSRRYDTNERYFPKSDVNSGRSTANVPQKTQSAINGKDNLGILYAPPSLIKFTEPKAIPTRRPDNDIVFTTSTLRTTTPRELIEFNSDSKTYSETEFVELKVGAFGEALKPLEATRLDLRGIMVADDDVTIMDQINLLTSSDEESDIEDDDGYIGGIPTIYIPTNLDKGSSVRQKVQCGKAVFSSTNPILDTYGSPTLEGQYPWQVALYKTQRTADNKYICGGTLVTHRHVVTAAHCVARPGSRKLVNKNTLTMYLGKYNLRTSVEGVQVKFVENIIIHPEYNATTLSRDLAILQLKEPITYTDHVRPVCLWPESLIDLNSIIGKQGSLVGWGSEVSGATKQELNLVKMPVVDQETCTKSYNAFIARIISDYSYCAAYAEGTTACNGDSGGGMIFKSDGTWYLRGVASLSVAQQNQYRCDANNYFIFTDVAKLLPWIKNYIHDY